MTELRQWLYDRPGTEIRISYEDAAGQVVPSARNRIIRGTEGSRFVVRIISPDSIFCGKSECVGSATEWGTNEDAFQYAVREAMKKAGDKGSWA